MWRAPLRGFLLVLVAAGVAILSLGLWARYTVYDENQFVSVVGGLSSNPTVQKVAVDQIMTEVDRKIQTEIGQQGLSPAIGITYQMFRPQIESGIAKALASPQFQPLWEQALRELHGPLTDLLKGNDTPNLKQSDNQIQINLYPAYEMAKNQLGPTGTQLLSQLNITEDSLWISLLKGDTLVRIQDYVKLFNRMLAVGIIVSVLSAVGYVLLSSRKLRAMAWVLLAIAAGLLIQRAALALGMRQLVESLQAADERSAAKIFYDTLVGDLRQFELWALIAAVVAAVAIYLIDRYLVQKELREAGASIESAGTI